jgi:hypothetical protein
MKVRVKVESKNNDDLWYDFDDFQEASYFVGLLVYGVKINNKLYLMTQHYFDTVNGVIVAQCINRDDAIDEANKISGTLAKRINPLFKTKPDDEEGGLPN